MFKSIDGGASWSPSNVGLANVNLLAMTRDTSGSTNNLYVASYGGVFVSTDRAASWTPVNVSTGSTVLALAFDGPFGYVGTQTRGVFVQRPASLFLPLIFR